MTRLQVALAAGRLQPGDARWLPSDADQWLDDELFGDGVTMRPVSRTEAIASLAAMLAAVRRLRLPRPLLLLDGLRAVDDAGATVWLGGMLRAADAADCPLLYEAPPRGVFEMAGVDPGESIELAPLEPGEAQGLATSLAAETGAVVDLPDLLPVLDRLGMWPGLIRAWARQLPVDGVGLGSRRLVETAYVDLLTRSAWSRRLHTRLGAVLAPGARETALRLVAQIATQRKPVTADWATRAIGDPAAGTAILDGLERLELIRPVGTRWQGPHAAAVSDWARLQLELAETGDTEAARVGMLTRLLAAAPRTVSTAQTQMLRDVLGAFNCQTLPEVLFSFHDYYEAVGRLDPANRREVICRATHTFEVPEVVGIAEAGTRGAPPVLFAHAFREGRYGRAQQELWVAADLSAVRSLTTPEITAAREIAEQLRRQWDAPAVRLWLLVGETASADALELLRRERIYCSCVDQLAMLHELLFERRALSDREDRQTSAVPTPAEPPRTIVDWQGDASPRAESTSLRLPARADSEYIAALMAEKVAIRAEYPPTDAGKIKTAVLEGVLNAILYSPYPEKFIDVHFRLSSDALEVLIDNEGEGFDATRINEPDARAKLSAGNKRGWGITLMRKFMDVVEYEPHGNGTRLRLVKKRPAIAPVALAQPSGPGPR